MRNAIKQWWLPAVVLVAANLVSVKLGADRLNSQGPGLNTTIERWIANTKGADCSFTLEVAKNVADGKGTIQQDGESNPPKFCPFTYWSPGAPWALGAWLWLVNGKTMWSCFAFSALSQFLFGAIALATTALYSRRTGALVATAFFGGFCPAAQAVFYSWMLTGSEIVAWVPIGLMCFALGKAFLLKANPEASLRSIVAWFAIAGICAGVASLARGVNGVRDIRDPDPTGRMSVQKLGDVSPRGSVRRGPLYFAACRSTAGANLE